MFARFSSTDKLLNLRSQLRSTTTNPQNPSKFASCWSSGTRNWEPIRATNWNRSPFFGQLMLSNQNHKTKMSVFDVIITTKMTFWADVVPHQLLITVPKRSSQKQQPELKTPVRNSSFVTTLRSQFRFHLNLKKFVQNRPHWLSKPAFFHVALLGLSSQVGKILSSAHLLLNCSHSHAHGSP